MASVMGAPAGRRTASPAGPPVRVGGGGPPVAVRRGRGRGRAWGWGAEGTRTNYYIVPDNIVAWWGMHVRRA